VPAALSIVLFVWDHAMLDLILNLLGLGADAAGATLDSQKTLSKRRRIAALLLMLGYVAFYFGIQISAPDVFHSYSTAIKALFLVVAGAAFWLLWSGRAKT
jgi:hypothetical protein